LLHVVEPLPLPTKYDGSADEDDQDSEGDEDDDRFSGDEAASRRA
jgi:hypothetical protein